MSASGTLRCPVCGREAPAERSANPFLPFCSSRCRKVDLGRWLDESYGAPVRDGEDGAEDPAGVPPPDDRPRH